MNRLNTSIITIFTIFSLNAMSAGFKDGIKFQAHFLSGKVTVMCTQDSYTTSIDTECKDSYLSPTSWSKLTVNDKVKADRVRLTYRDKRGKIRIKDRDFIGALGESDKKINLWYRTLFQRPILKLGSNEIYYELTQDREVTSSGSFSVFVQEQPKRQCPNDTINSSRMTDCRDPINACRLYFSRHNNCF